MIAEGDVFLIELPPGSGIKHFYVVISDPAQDQTKIAIINVTTWETGEDDACFLSASQWQELCPFLKHDSYVRYRSARIVDAATIGDWLNKGIASKRPRACRELLEAIRKGAEETQFLPNKCCLLLNDQGLLEL